MPAKNPETSSVDDRPVYFRVFNRESLAALKQRMLEEETRLQLEKEQKKGENKQKHVVDDEDEGPKPNEKMEQGEALPVRLAAAFEEDMAGIPMEDIDPFYKNIPTFVIITKKMEIFRFSATNAMGLLSPFNPVRRVAIGVLTHWMFSLCIITTILTNCYVMIIPATPVTESTEVVFTAIYTFESAVKVFARGFILEKFTYLRDAWNWLDFVVISLAYVTMAIDLGNLAALRTCRVFRALKTVAIVPGLKTIVGAVIESVKNLRDVIILTIFALAVFGLIGLQIYMGVLTQKCIADFPEDGSEGAERDERWEAWNQNITNWHPYPPPEEYGAADYPLCGNSSGSGMCPENYTCLQGYGPNPNYGYTSFDSFGWAFLASFRLMTQDFWESLYQQILRSAGPWHMLFFIFIIFLGSYYLVNLILAIVAMSYDELEKKAEADRLSDEAELEAMAREEEEREQRAQVRAEKKQEERVQRAQVRAEKKAEAIAEAEADAKRKKAESGGGFGFSAGGDKGSGGLDEVDRSPSKFSSRSYETWTGVQEEDDRLREGNGSSYCSGIPVRRDSSVSLPGSPYRSCPPSQQHHRRTDKLILLSTYIDAQTHLPYADDSTAATPISAENGAMLLPFCNGFHESFYRPHNNCTRHASYSSHLSRSTYNSHQNIFIGGGRNSCGLEHPLTKESQLIQRARNLQGDVGQDHGEALPRYRDGSVDKTPILDRKRIPNARTGSGGEDGIDLKEAIERASYLSESTLCDDAEEPPTWKEIVKAKILEALLKCIDIFCLWDCGFPFSVFKKVVTFIVFDPFMELTITLSTITCVAFMAMDHYGLEEKVTMNTILKSGNMLFTVIFTLECTMKIIAMSPKYFFQIGWNIFDFLIVVISLVEVVFEDANVPGLSALRSFRLLRVFKLAKSWPTLNMILNIMGQTVGSLTNLVIVLVIIIFIFAVMGMQLFAKDYFEKTHLFPGGELPRWNFTDFGHSFMIIFRVLCGEWIESMWDCMLVSGGACVPFFLATVLIGNLVLLNLFLALLLSSFGGPQVGGDNEPNKLSEAFDRIARFKAWVKNGIKSFFKAILNGIIRLKNRILRISNEVEPDAATEAANARPRPRSKTGKKARLAKTATLVIASKKMMNAVQEQKAALDEAAIAAAPVPPSAMAKPKEDGLRAMSAKSVCSDKGHDLDESGGEVRFEKRRHGDHLDEEDEEDDEDYCDSDEWSECDDDEEDYKEEGMDGELLQGEIEDEGPQDCMPPGFYEKFPIFDVDDTPFGVFWANMRLTSFRLVENKYFETAVVVMILLSSLAMAFEDVHLPNNPVLTDILFYLDRIFTVIFFFEMLLKWVAMGFVTFFTNAWCWLDFFIVMISLINLIAALAGAGSVQAFKTLKTLRALRPLKAMAKMEGMRVVVNALVQSIPSITNVLMVCLIFWLIFAIMGVQLFNGKFHKCLDPEDGSRPDYRIIRNKFECLAVNFTWENSVMNFDHVGQAYLSLFQVATFKGWIGIMNDAIDSREIDDQPHREVSFAMYGFFVCFIIFGSFFTLNLFIGVIIDNFNEQQKKAGASVSSLMTEDQKKYYAAMQKMKGKKPIKAIPKPTWKPQLLVFNFVTNQKFDMVIMLFIGLNMAVMMCDHYQQTEEWDSTLGLINSVFVAVFTGESLLKMFALRCHYFKEPWNLFDVIVVFMSVAGMMLSDLIEKYFVSPTLLRVVRVAKVGRVLRLVKGAKGIRTLLFSLAMSLPALFNICLLLFLIMFIFAIFGMSFFMNVKLRGALDEVYNFQTFTQSFILLFQMSTSAGWDGVLEGIRDEEDCEQPDPELGKSGDCGNATVAIAFLLSYLVISFLIVINMYIAVILDNYSHATEEVQEGLTDDDYDMYYEIWAQFDPEGHQYIPYHMLSDFVDVLEPPLQIYKPNKIKLATMDIPICKGDMMHCVDILDALTKEFFARKGNPVEITDDVPVVPTDRPNYEPVSSTLQRRREDYCAWRIQKIWREYKRVRVNQDPSNTDAISAAPAEN